MTGTKNKKEKGKRTAILTCPACSHLQRASIPASSCQAFYQCKGCSKRIQAKKNCCVFCDYSNQTCDERRKEYKQEKTAKKRSTAKRKRTSKKQP
ncbi:hypothetical protein HYS47_05720 [Candidatus Woesearchaeota archaeon]|nr:hypothetical protein [Candidatus Woesearchaeota archaeon]